MNANVKDFARQLSDKLLEIEDAKVECASIVEAAKDAGINTKALRKVAREMVMDSTKLAKLYDDEEQLEMFRSEVGIRQAKGLAEIEGGRNRTRLTDIKAAIEREYAE